MLVNGIQNRHKSGMSTLAPKTSHQRTDQTRPRYHHGSLRAALIDGATETIRSVGEDAMSLRALANEIGVTHRASSAHFRNKEALVAAVLTEAYERLDRLIQIELEPLETPDIVDTIKAIATAYGAFAKLEGKLFLLMNGRRLNTDGDYPELEHALTQAFGRTADAISSANLTDKARSSAIEAKVSKEPDNELLALHVWACLSGVLVQWALGRIRVREDSFDAFMRNTALRIAEGIG